MYRLYRFLIPLYFTGIRIAGFFRRDARKWVEGRSGWYDTLDRFISSLSGHSQKRIWIHVSSLGEFEQGREVLEAIKDGHPEAVVILSFFSPSGYDKRKDYPLADYVCYFPSDRYSTMQNFIGKLQPDLALFVKYDFWFNCLHILNQRNIPFVYFSLALRKNHFLLHPLSHSLLDKLRPAKQLFVQNQQTFDLLNDRGFQNISLSGDTRVDRVCRIAEERGVDPLILSFCGSQRIFIGGSVWPQDLDQITPALLIALRNGWKLILVPHVPDEKHLSDMEQRFPEGSIR
ncbi:MAG TPA: glycosyltransferase N-terminal domain-containing protein, partial [Saprospiraceae bacterium]|nr:glycosyltransferase N-terminal domain-containing protein [Saprospiraceae bacterium]